MYALNKLMNHVANLSYSESFFVRNISTRAVMTLAGVPLEILTSFQNLVFIPIQPLGVLSKFTIKILNMGIDSQRLRNFEEKYLPGIPQILITALKVFGYALGAVFSATLGFVYPWGNFKLHCALGLITDEKTQAERHHLEMEILKQKAAQELALKAQIQSMLLVMRRKAHEQEIRKTEEALKQQKALELVKAAKLEDQRMQAVREQHQIALRAQHPVLLNDGLLTRVWKRGTRFFGYQEQDVDAAKVGS